MDPYTVLRDCRLASGDRYRAGDEAHLTPAAAKYPLLRGWIASAPPPAELESGPESGPEPPGRRRRRSG